ncbi:MAG: hypothetical protein ABIP77_10165 [Candidatus Limnocylindrales bacterium]
MPPPTGRSGIGLLAFAVIAIIFVVLVAAVAFAVGHQLAAAQEALKQMQ